MLRLMMTEDWEERDGVDELGRLYGVLSSLRFDRDRASWRMKK